MKSLILIVASVATLVGVGLHLRWFLAAGSDPLTGFLSRSDDPVVESRRRAFLISIVPVVVLSWVVLLTFEP